jgi:hypothetical protein
LSGKSYTCAQCGGTFETNWSEADAVMEFQEAFTERERSMDADPPAQVCDDCYRDMMRFVHEFRAGGGTHLR